MSFPLPGLGGDSTPLATLFTLFPLAVLVASRVAGRSGRR
jgi:hypothetical protein